jgi:hypothetical protein
MMSLVSELIKRIEQTGDVTPGQYHLVADVLHIAGLHMRPWTKRCDDANRIPDVLFNSSDILRDEAENISQRGE